MLFNYLNCQQLLQKKFQLLHSHFFLSLQRNTCSQLTQTKWNDENSFDYMHKRVLEFSTLPFSHLIFLLEKSCEGSHEKIINKNTGKATKHVESAKCDWLRQDQHWVMESVFFQNFRMHEFVHSIMWYE